MAWKTQGTGLYQQLPNQCFETLRECQPLTEEKNQAFKIDIDYKPFKK